MIECSAINHLFPIPRKRGIYPALPLTSFVNECCIVLVWTPKLVVNQLLAKVEARRFNQGVDASTRVEIC